MVQFFYSSGMLWGCKGVVLGRNNVIRSKEDDNLSSGWWNRGPGLKVVGFGSKSSRSTSECISFDAKECRGLTEVVLDRNNSIRSKGDDNSSSSWWDKGPGVEMA